MQRKVPKFQEQVQYIIKALLEEKSKLNFYLYFTIRSTKNAVAIFLMKLRLGLSQRILAFLFDIRNASVVSDCVRDVLMALKSGFVDRHLGYQHISREFLQASHMSRYFSKVLELPEDRLVTILDGTYLYVEVNMQLYIL